MTAIPRLASTVALLDSMSRVYLTKRPDSMRFLGGFYVFPGGALEISDYVQDSVFIRHSFSPNDLFIAHYVAAARELFEEAGVLLCSTKEGSAAVLNEETTKEYRRQLLKGEISFLQMLKQENLYFDTESLKYFGHLITPKDKPVRFDTRFFLAQLPPGQSPDPDFQEIDKAVWLSPEEAFLEFQKRCIALAKPTIHALSSINNYLHGEPLRMSEW